MAVLFSDDWTGSNGAAWNAAKWPTIEVTSTSTVTIQGNQGQSNPGGAGFARARGLSASGTLTDFELTMKFTLASGGTTEQYHSIFLRHDGAWSGNNVLNGYRFIISPSTSEYAFTPYVGGAAGSSIADSKSFDTAQWSIRLRFEGTAIKAKAWSGSEPGPWDIETTNASFASGIMSFISMCGASATARPILYDDLVIEDLITVRKFILTRP